MADDLTLDEGTGAKKAATDEVTSNRHIPWVKVASGGDNETYGALVDSSGHLQVDVNAAPSTAVTNADITSCKTALEIIDDWDASDHCNIRHLNATDDIVLLGTGSNAIGKLAANSGVDIGDVDILSIAAGDNNIGNVDIVTFPVYTVDKAIQWSHYSNEYTTAQTSTDLVALSGSTKFYIGRLTIGTGGTTAGLVTVYFGTGAYSAGSSKTVFRGNFAPASTAYPGVVIGDGNAPFIISAAGDALKITTGAAITVYVQVDYVRV